MPTQTNWRARLLSGGLAGAVAFIVSLGLVYAFSSLEDDFLDYYPSSTMDTYTEWAIGDDCDFCHVPPSESTKGNAYLIDMENNGNAVPPIDDWDSDGDGVPNGIEAERPRVDVPTTIGGNQQFGYNPGLIDCPDGTLGYDPYSMQEVTGVSETPPEGTVWAAEDPAVNCNDNLDNDCDGDKDEDDPDCNPPACSSNAECDDGNFCNGQEICDPSLGCVAPPLDPCPDQMCDESANACVDCLADSNCNDGFFCNGVETCSDGICLPGPAVNCTDGVSCTNDSCNESTDSCTHVPVDSACSDSAFCNGVETCDAQSGCQPAEAGPCGELSCDEGTDQCVGCLGDGDCNDGNLCNGLETCNGGTCQSGTPLVCDDPLFCNGIETCNPTSGCQTGFPPCAAGSCNETVDQCEATDGTLVFRDGTGYDGTRDTFLEAGNTSKNNAAAVSWSWDKQDDVTGETRGLIKFVGIVGGGPDRIPQGATVLSATLILTMFDPSSSPPANVYLAPIDWNESTVNWSNYANLAGNGNTLIATAPVANGTGAVNVTTAVQRWVDDPSSNYGLYFVPQSTNGAHVRSSEYSTIAQRPALTVEYTTAAVSCVTDADCTDGVFCNGTEQCIANVCQSGAIPDCNDNNACTDDSCLEQAATCVNVFDPTNQPGCVACPDEDQDGFSTAGGDCGLLDCNDANASVFPDAPEMCQDSIDNNCSGQQDDAVCDFYDVNADAGVDGTDLAWLGKAFGLCSATPENEWWYRVDSSKDGCVDGTDLSLLGTAWNCITGDNLCD